MASLRGVPSAARRALASTSWLCSLRRSSNSSFCDDSSSSSPIMTRLIHEPKSQIKATLDSDQFSAFRQDPQFPWRSLLVSLASSPSPDKARLVLEWRLEKLVNENVRDHERYVELISLCGTIRDLELAMRICTSMEARRIELTCAVFNSLILVCFSSGNVLAAFGLYEIMEKAERFKPDSGTFDAFISGFSKLGNFGAMQAWYSAKKAAGLGCDLQNYESLISGCIKSGNLEGADRFYEEMRVMGLEPSLTILENVLEGLCKRRSSDAINEFVKSVIDGGWKISERMVEMVVGLYFDLGKVEEMEELLATLVETEQASKVLSMVHCGIVRLSSLLDRLDLVEYAVGRMLKQGLSFRSPDDVEKIICAYFRQNAYDRLDLFLERIKGCYEFRRSTYDLLIAGYRRAGLSNKVDLVMNEIKSAGFL